MCESFAPEVFHVDDGVLRLLNEHPPEEYRESVREAEDACPVEAITIVDSID